jgi:hypothetical protein
VIGALFDLNFQREVHRLLWITPLINAGEFDAGWSCRDHAVLLAAFLAVNTVRSEIVHGRCMFVQGPVDGAPSVGLGQELQQRSGHSWLDVPSAGMVDLSPNLSLDVPGGWRSVEFAAILFDRWWPLERGRVVKCVTAQIYEAEVAQATHQDGEATAIYLEQRRERFDPPNLVKAIQTIDSPLSDRIYERHGPLAYGAALVHLLEFVAGKARSIASVSQTKAWLLVMEKYPKPLETLLSIMGPSAPR